MKIKFLFLIISLFFIFSSLAIAGEKIAIITWEQEICPDLSGWYLYHSTNKQSLLDEWNRIADIEYTGKQKTYSCQKNIQSPDGKEQIHYLYMTAHDNSGNESNPSNIANATIDFKAPGNPFTLTVEIKTKK